MNGLLCFHFWLLCSWVNIHLMILKCMALTPCISYSSSASRPSFTILMGPIHTRRPVLFTICSAEAGHVNPKKKNIRTLDSISKINLLSKQNPSPTRSPFAIDAVLQRLGNIAPSLAGTFFLSPGRHMTWPLALYKNIHLLKWNRILS